MKHKSKRPALGAPTARECDHAGELIDLRDTPAANYSQHPSTESEASLRHWQALRLAGWCHISLPTARVVAELAYGRPA